MSVHPATLPAYSADQLAQSSPEELVRLLIRNEDRVPRSLIDECVRRGGAMLDHLEEVLRKDYYWGDDLGSGEWWLRLHAVMILGLVPDARAGELILGYMRRIDESGDANLHDWLAGKFAAFMRNKPESVYPAVRALAEDRERTPYIRSDATEAAIAWAESRGGSALDEALEWLARRAFDADSDLEHRAFAGSTLLDFARPEYRAGLEALADLQDPEMPIFDRELIEQIYAEGGAEPSWKRFADPWQFYERREIAKRQLRWAEEALEEEEKALEREYEELRGETFVRESPKVGRNEPCPCGSGKKYKKCCMAGAAGA